MLITSGVELVQIVSLHDCMGPHLPEVLMMYILLFQDEFEQHDQTVSEHKRQSSLLKLYTLINTSDFSFRLSPAVKLKAFAFHSHTGVTEAFIHLNAPLNFLTCNLSIKLPLQLSFLANTGNNTVLKLSTFN